MEHVLNDSFRGCIFVRQAGEAILERAQGYADLANQIPVSFATKFATASAGKVFVAVGILQLIERGVLHLEDTIGTLLPMDWQQVDQKITVEQLLTHTSGIPDYFDESVMSEYEELWFAFPNYRIRSNQDLLPLFINKPMMYARGSKFQYNNTGFVVLALIIETITGMAFDQYLQTHIFAPCGMNDTGYYELDMLPGNCASNYIYDEKRGGYRSNIFSVDAKGTGAGGAFTTVSDIVSFWEALLSYQLLSKTMTQTMLANHSGSEECYGYGIWLQKIEERFVPYFQGSDPGVSFLTSYDIDKQLLMVIVSNYGDNVWKLRKEINAYLLD